MRPATEITDPFFAALRARRPDADIVILPPELPPARPPALPLELPPTERRPDKHRGGGDDR